MLLFLGAGSSKAFGIPDTRGFIAEFEAVIGENEIYTKIKKTIPKEFLDMETLMTILDDLSKTEDELLNSIAPHTTRFILANSSDIPYLIKDEDLKSSCRELLLNIKRVIRTKCLNVVSSDRMEVLNQYDAFFGALEIGKGVSASDTSRMQYPVLKIFTTNYDTCIETYFNSRRVDLSRGAVDRFSEYVFDVDSFSTSNKNVELVKLHGSIDLFVQDKKIRFLPGAGAIDTTARTYLGDEYGREFMIYPVESSTSTEMFQSPHIELLHIFRDRLMKSDTWIIIGSTFRDSTLTSIMNDVLIHKAEIQHPVVIHINPEAKHINTYLSNKGYKALSDIIKPIDMGFMDEKVGIALKSIRLRG